MFACTGHTGTRYLACAVHTLCTPLVGGVRRYWCPYTSAAVCVLAYSSFIRRRISLRSPYAHHPTWPPPIRLLPFLLFAVRAPPTRRHRKTTWGHGGCARKYLAVRFSATAAGHPTAYCQTGSGLSTVYKYAVLVGLFENRVKIAIIKSITVYKYLFITCFAFFNSYNRVHTYSYCRLWLMLTHQIMNMFLVLDKGRAWFKVG